ncbi:disease resistance protein RPM1-like [Mangifera indica]|uniref:disease resistance protein RPM1-like n=1 Tax=Mangifera indica TaxID=29780 RepID=UPI001CFA7B7A|nr:disease resistance protein RPM1-like [Mangifera indica]
MGSALLEVDTMEKRDLIMMLREHLKDKCYMIVFEDVWKIEFWKDVEHALLGNNQNSRVVLTTRNKAVAEFVPFSMAEGFVQSNNHLQSKHFVEEYLEELIDRNLVQVLERTESGRVRFCRVHDMMYEIIHRKREECYFCLFSNERDLNHFCKTWRISIQERIDEVLESIKNSKIRSVFLFDVGKLPKSFMTTLVTTFKLIKVLDFENAPVDSLPNGVGKLFHLHYLSLKNTKVKELPKSINMLINLETLNLKWTPMLEFSIEIKNLKQLQSLIFQQINDEGPCHNLVKIPKGFGALTELQSLLKVHIHSEALKELKMLTQLRKLRVNLVYRDVWDLFAIVENMENFERLSVRLLTSGKEIVDLESVASPPQCLERLDLGMYIKKLPIWISELQNLIRLELILVGSTNDLMRDLQALPNLLVFILTVRDYDEELHFKEGWFPKLQVLCLYEFIELKRMVIEKDSLLHDKR